MLTLAERRPPAAPRTDVPPLDSNLIDSTQAEEEIDLRTVTAGNIGTYAPQDTLTPYENSTPQTQTVIATDSFVAHKKLPDPGRLSRRRFLEIGTAALLTSAAASAIAAFEIVQPPHYPEIKKPVPAALSEGDPINGLENSFVQNNRLYFERDAIEEMAKEISGPFGWQTLESALGHSMFHNLHGGESAYSGIDLVQRGGKDYYKIEPEPTENGASVSFYNNGKWEKSQTLPVAWQTFRDDDRQIDWQTTTAISNSLMEYVLSHTESLAMFFPNNTAPDIKVRIPDPDDEILKTPNMPKGEKQKPAPNDTLILAADKLIDFGDVAQIGILQGVTAHFFSHIDMMLYQNSENPYNPKTLDYIWGHVLPQLKAESSLPRPNNWPKDKPFTLFDSIFHPGVYERSLIGQIDISPTPQDALASMLYLSSLSDLQPSEVADRFTALQTPLPSSAGKFDSEDLVERDTWEQAVNLVKTERGAIVYATDALSILLRNGCDTYHGSFPKMFPLFSSLFVGSVFNSVLTIYDPWADKPTHMADSIRNIYGTYTAGVSDRALMHENQQKAFAQGAQ